MNSDVNNTTHNASDMTQQDKCQDCDKLPCVCPNKNEADERQAKKGKRPKISWI